jgi:membrane protein YqaA with SNARE-associated domain
MDLLPAGSALWALFASAFISATLLPGGSEALLAYLAYRGEHGAPLLLAVATAGNTLGGMSSWGLGWLIALRFPAERLTDPRRRGAVERVRRWGSPVLLLSWLPVIGDPLCFAAGWLRVHWLAALAFIGIGKAARYAVVLWAFL